MDNLIELISNLAGAPSRKTHNNPCYASLFSSLPYRVEYGIGALPLSTIVEKL
jgi:hypothetical protein